jgi:hypothetical protein
MVLCNVRFGKGLRYEGAKNASHWYNRSNTLLPCVTCQRSKADDMDDLGQVVINSDMGYEPFKHDNHTVGPTCGEDYDKDRDADGENLAKLINNFDPNKLVVFAAEFGQYCP